MKSLRIKHLILLSALLRVFSAGEATAAERALLMLGGFEQWVDLVYNFDRHKTKTSRGSSSRTQHYLKEEYHFGTSYAIWNPRILRGKLLAGIGVDQNFASGSNSRSEFSSGSNFQYSLTGAILERSPTPLHFFSHSELIHAQREFASPYDINVDRNGLFFMLRNRLLPVKFDYIRTTSETSGLGAGRIQTSDTASLNVNHKLLQVTNTEAQVTHLRTRSLSKGDGSESERRTANLRVSNQLYLSRNIPGRILSSRIEVRDEAATPAEDSSMLALDEQLVWPLGKALTTGASYLMSTRETSFGTDRHQNSRAWLQHMLFDSLTTQVNGEYSNDNLIAGSEQNVTGSVDIAYQKRLASDSRLQLNLFQQYQITDRAISSSVIAAVDELHTVVLDPLSPSFLTTISLRNPDVLPETIMIKNADPRIRLLPYVLNADYAIEPIGLLSQIVILPGSEINPGETLLISYSYLINPLIKYSTNSRRVGFNLMLFRNAYLIDGSWSESKQDLISGRADSIRLVDDKRYKLGFEGNRYNYSYGGEYENFDSDLDKHQTMLGFIRYSRNFPRNSLALYLTDTYTITKPATLSGFNSPEREVTTISAGGTLSTLLFSTAQLLLSAKYVNLRGDTSSRDDISLGLNLRWNYGKMALSILSQINWRILPGVTSEDEYIRLHMTRYF